MVTLHPSRCALTFHVHCRCFVHKVHKKLSCVDQDLITTVADGTVPPCALNTNAHIIIGFISILINGNQLKGFYTTVSKMLVHKDPTRYTTV